MNKTWWLMVVLLGFPGAVGQSQTNNFLDVRSIGRLDDTHDISLPAWGPYSKKYAGISHIPDMKQGLRFDVSMLPGYYRGRVLIPNVLFESGYYPWDINPSMTQVTYRYELEWKDKVFVDVTYSQVAANTVLVGMHCVNDSALAQNLALNLVGSLDYPDAYPAVKTQLPEGSRWVNAINYRQLDFAHPRPSDGLVYDGWLRGEVRGNEYLDGSAIAKEFGKDRGDKIGYSVSIPPAQLQGTISVRYRAKDQSQVSFRLTGLAEQTVALIGTGKFELVHVPYSCDKNGDYPLNIESQGGNGIELNGFFVGPSEDAKNISLVPVEKKFTPELTPGGDKSLILKYKDVEDYYGIAWDFSPTVVREVLNDELDIFFRKTVHDHVNQKLVGNQLGHYANVFMRPVELAPKSEKTVFALVCNGTLESVRRQIASFAASPGEFTSKAALLAGPRENVLPEGEKYVFSQKLMKATVLNDIVYPIYTQRSYIRHFTPGKWWNSLYTWDDGFIALGLSEIDPNLAVQCLNAYTTPAGNQSAFIHHGSPVPVQMYAFFDLWNKTQSREFLDYFYPRLKRYYDFLSGKTGGSTTRGAPSNLLKTWDYFYNSGGWDDYPAQRAVHEQKLEARVAPVITTAQCIRVAKILRLAAETLALDADVKAYDRDIADFSAALQTYSWDPQSGYYSYVVHDEQGKPVGYFRHGEAGQNYNQGLDGAYPLFSGICTPQQQRILLDNIFSEKKMWTPSGICVVDQSADYYRIDGYWNGAVWMPHQWFMWKTMLDLGRSDLAWKIAEKGLDVWKRETDESYHTFEHFLADNGRGAGWHQFSGLSTPVLSWFSAYFKPGTVTAGFEVLIKKQSFGPEFSGYEAELSFDKATVAHSRCLLICLSPAKEYEATFNGEQLKTSSPHRGLIQINLPSTNEDGKLVVKPAR